MQKTTQAQARALWIHSQKLNQSAPFGRGAQAVEKAIKHLGYVQIDTINVIERCHHHILYNRIPEYKKSDLHTAQTKEKTVFEYWAHALAYLPTEDYRFSIKAMRQTELNPSSWFESVMPSDLKNIIAQIKKNGPVSIRDMTDEILVEKDHAWASRKPSKKVLQFGFYTGKLVISERLGMLKKYDIAERHFSWDTKPVAATKTEILNYLLDRSLKSQGLVSLESICYLDAKKKSDLLKIIEQRVQSKKLIEIVIDGRETIKHWISPKDLDLIKKMSTSSLASNLTHILSPFDPLIIQRKRLNLFFDYEHRFEAYIPKEKRVFGYFTLPVLVDNEIKALLDLKTDRLGKKVLIQNWTWLKKHKTKENKKRIEEALDRFERFQLHV